MSSEIRALVVDDEPLARVNLRALLDQQQGWTLAGEAGSGPEARVEIERVRPDVVFLDVRMPGLSGLEVAKLLRDAEPCPLIVFATAFEEYAVDAFEVEATDYLIKPFERERFSTTLRRLERRLERDRNGVAPQTVPLQTVPLQTATSGPPAAPETPPTLAVKSVGRVRLVQVEDIYWVAAAGNYARLYLADACYLHRTTLAALEQQLASEGFVRIHRSTMINRRRVAELRTSVAGRYQVVLIDGTELEISQRFKQRVFSTLMPA
ncbi:MAG: LytTR family DNA-binding domain-containing protein [Acidobacteriota bacterium]